MTYKQLISSRLAIGLLILLLGFLGYLKFQQYRSQQDIEKQKQALIDQAQNLQKKNDDLNQSLSYLNTPGFKERLVREQLNLKKDGEVVYNFGDQPAHTSDAASASATHSDEPNYKKWLNYYLQP